MAGPPMSRRYAKAVWGSVQDRAAGGCRLLSRLTRSEGGFAQARRISAMADRLGAEQNLKNDPHVCDIRFSGVSGLSRRTGVADCRIKQGTCRLARSLSALAFRKRGEKLAMPQHPRPSHADQIAPRRDPALDQRQFPEQSISSCSGFTRLHRKAFFHLRTRPPPCSIPSASSGWAP